MEITDQPPAATVSSTKSPVKRDRTRAQHVAMAGLRRNFQPLKPSMGASFQAPPTAVAHPPAKPTVVINNTVGIGGSACCIASIQARPAIVVTATATPTV